MPYFDFDTRKPQEPNEPNRVRIRVIASKLRNLSIASKRRTLFMANALRSSLMANRVRSLLIGGWILLFVAVAVPIGLLIYSSGGMGDQQQKASGWMGDQQWKAEDANLKPLAACADGGGRHQQEVNADYSNGKKIVFVRGEVVYYPGHYAKSSNSRNSIEMYAVNADGTGLSQLTKATATEYGITSELPDGREVTIDWSADGRKIASIYFYNKGGSPVYGEGVCSPDGKKLAVSEVGADYASATANNTDDIRVHTSAGTTKLGAGGTNDGEENGAAWSPDSQKIAFMRDGDVYVANADGSEQTNITNSTAVDDTPTWSPDSEKIAFISDGKLYTVDADGTGLTQLTNNVAAQGGSLVFSADGKKIAFISAGDVYVINADGSDLTRLTENAGVYDPPVISLDSEQIAFISTRSVSGQPVEYDLYAVNVDGTGLTRLTNTAAWEGIVTWVGG